MGGLWDLTTGTWSAFDFICPRATGNAVTDTGALTRQINNAISAGVGRVIFQATLPATPYSLNAMLPQITIPTISVLGPGVGLCVLKPTAAVTAGNFLSYRPAYSTAEAGTVAGFKIDLSSVGINTVGFDFGETTGLTLDLGVWNGTAAGCVGIQQKNVTNWTERTHGFVDVRNNATGYLFDTAVGSSHARTELTIFVNANAGQSGVVMQNGVHVYESDLRIKGNIAGTGIALSMLDTSLYSGSIQFGCEGDGGGTAYGLSLAAGTNFSAGGVIRASLGSLTNSVAGTFKFMGYINAPGYSTAGYTTI